MEKINVAIADDDGVFRKYVIHILETDSSNRINILIVAKNGAELLTKLQTTKPDVILMDIEMPKINGIEATKKIMAIYPHMKIIALTHHDSEKYVSQMYAYKVKGFLVKRDISKLPQLIESVYEGKYYIMDKVLSVISRQLKKILKMEKRNIGSAKSMTSEKDFEKLTPMELKVLWHTALLKSIKQIAKELSLSPHTVNNHQAGIRKKLNLIGRNSLVQYAVDNKERLEDL
jgi:two-component system response regulator DegU